MTVKLCCTWAAGFQLESPAWSALMTQVPGLMKLTVAPESAQPVLLASRLKVTPQPEDAVAVTI